VTLYRMLTCGTCCDSSFTLTSSSSPIAVNRHWTLHLSARCSSSMFSLLSRSSLVSTVGIPGSTPCCWPSVWRFFSLSHTKGAAPESSEARRKRLDRQAELRLYRYHNDPDFRKRLIEYNRQRRLNDPDSQKEKTADELARYNSDPVYREYRVETMRLRDKKWRAQNPGAHAEHLRQRRLVGAARRADDPRYNFRMHLHGWLLHNACAQTELPWKAHVPVVYGEKVLRKCAGRDRLPHFGANRLWYVHSMHSFDTQGVDVASQEGSAKLCTNNSKLTMSRWELRKDSSKEDADEYLCHSCYIPKENWQEALPRGYEDVKNMRELAARKKKHDSGDHGSQSVNHTKSK